MEEVFEFIYIKEATMNSNTSLSGEYLKTLYTENKLTDDLQTPENLKNLLNYELDCMGDTFDPDYSFEIIDFCVEKLKELEPIDEQKMNFLGQKIMLEAKEYDRQQRFRRLRSFAVYAAMIGIVVGVMLFSGAEGYAGKFDFVHRLLSQDKGEQLSLKTSDMTLSQIEMKEGHLPETMPDEFQFIKSFKENTSKVWIYNYSFRDSENKELIIVIKEYPNAKIAYNNEIEIDKQSAKQEIIDNHTCYYSSNINSNTISWSQENSIYMINGDFSFNQLEEIVSQYNNEG